MEQFIFAHRGASGYAPENTLPSFSLAAKMGAHGIELDVQLSRDGELVVIHDETVDRTSNGSGWVFQKTLSELKSLDFSAGFPEQGPVPVPTLAEVFDLIKPTGLRINIELKNSRIDYPGLEQRCIDLADRAGMLDRVIFSSFNHNSMQKIKQINPDLKCGLLYDAVLVKPWEYAKAIGADAIHPLFCELFINKDECAAAHEAGLAVNTWTVNEEEFLRMTIAAGADIIITNYPDRALRLLSQTR